MSELIFLAAMVITGGDVCDHQVPNSEPRRFHEIDKDIQEAFRREATARTTADRVAAIHQLIQIHREIVGDTRFTSSDALKEFRGKVASRLNKIRLDVKGKVARDRKGRGKVVEPEAPSLADDATNALSSQLLLVGFSAGGPVQLLLSSSGYEESSTSQNGNAGARGGGGVSDLGPELVDLIERTISPKFWDVNGGPGTIIYYRPLHCLVVRATGEIHGDVGAVLGGLRDVGR